MRKLAFYKNRMHLLEEEHKTLKNKSLLYSWIRLIVGLSFLVPLILFFTIVPNLFLVIFSLLFLGLFFVLVIKHNKLENNILNLSSKIEIDKEEMLFLAHKFQHRESGSEYVKINPFLAEDFNLFGIGSLFQYLNRCHTITGKRLMAQKLCNVEKDKNLILRKQSAINELSKNADYIQEFLSYSSRIPEHRSELSTLKTWINEPYEDVKKSRNIAILFCSLNISWLLLAAFGVLTWASFLYPIILSQIIISVRKKRISKHHAKINDSFGDLTKYTKLLKLIEDQPFQSEYLRSLQTRLNASGTKASMSFSMLFTILNVLEIQKIALFNLLFNPILHLDIHICYQLMEWRKAHKDEVGKWFSTIGEMEVLISFAAFAFNNNENVICPELTDNEFNIEAVELGHPLLNPDLRVNNNFSINGVPSIQIITGANMAGKSTFLRTIAVNLILALNGAPVIAKKFSFVPCDIQSSIKVQDSLTDNQSYFYAELLRLKEIMEHVKTNPKTIIILDEILRGTNTKDKQTGSIGMIKKLISLNAIVIIATHDLSIAELENTYPEVVKNNCFEVELSDDQLFFDYKLKSGVSKKLNASFLMKKMEII